MSEVTTALAKSRVAWLLLSSDVTVPCWYAASGETAYVVSGDGEQPLPPLPDELRIMLRDKETRQAIGPVPARATRVRPDSEEWAPATTALLAARQNNPPGGLREHWSAHCAVWSLEVGRSTADTDPADGDTDPEQTESIAPD